MSEKTKFNVLEYEWNERDIKHYNVLPYFRGIWHGDGYNFDKDDVKDKDSLKKWIERTSQYNFWARCEYEFLMAPWPYNDKNLKDDLRKIDVHQQIMMNIDIITDLLYEEFMTKEK